MQARDTSLNKGRPLPPGFIYVISNPDQASDNIYKIGYYQGNLDKFILRHSRLIPDLMLYFSYDIPPEKHQVIQCRLHSILSNHCIDRVGRGGWYRLELVRIITNIIDVCQNIIIGRRRELDHLEKFIYDVLIVEEIGLIEAHTLYQYYKSWCKVFNEKKVYTSEKKLWLAFPSKGYSITKNKEKGKKKVRYIEGLIIKE